MQKKTKLLIIAIGVFLILGLTPLAMASALQEQNDVIAAADGTNRINTEGVKAQTTGDNTTAEFEDMT
ncbi:MAG: hypothetical protein ACFFCZ_23430, partial [Promethearchaeota archaeon]